MATKTQTGPNSWRYLIRIKGQPTLCRTFRDGKIGDAWAEKAEREMRDGKVQVRDTDTIAAAVRMFRELREKIGRPVGRQSNEHYMLNHLADPDGIGNVRIDRLNPERLAAWCRDRMDEGAGPCTIGMEVSKLGTALKYAAISMKTVLPDVVGAAMPLLNYGGLVGQSEHRDRRPTPEQLDFILWHLEPTMADVVRFACATAMRRGEISRILWEDVDKSRRLVLVRDRKHPRKKGGNHMLVPLIDKTGFDAWEILNRQPKVNQRIFPVSLETISDRFAEACRAADPAIEDLHFHDMRHHATSLLFEAGLEIQQVALVTGHKKWTDLKRYTNLRPESLVCGIPGTPPRPDSGRTAAPHPGTLAA